MAVRTDITINYGVSPRIITVGNCCGCATPSLAVLIQDLHDTIRTIEATPFAMAFPRIIDSAGKEAVGNCLFVGITSTLQNAQLEFIDRCGPCFVQATVRGGNLVALDNCCCELFPIIASDFTHVTISQAVSAVQIGLGSVVSDIACIKCKVDLLELVNNGRWRILNNQFIVFAADNTTPILRFNLLDASGNPTETNPFERFPTCP